MTTQPSSSPSSDNSGTSEPESAEPGDMQSRFRAALDRKRKAQSDRVHGGPGVAASSATHGAAGAKRVFRRKSG